MKNLYLLVLAVMLTLTGCSDQASQHSETTVAADVNGKEITKSQVNYLYERAATPGMVPQQSANLKRGILASLIRLELLADKAQEMGLDKSKDYVMEHYMAERKAMAALAENELVRKKVTISDNELDAFVQNNPHLFAQRKLFLYEAVQLGRVDQPLIESIEAMINKGQSLSQILKELRDEKIPFARRLHAQPVDKIPKPIFNVLNKVQPNTLQLLVFNQNDDAAKAAMIMMLHRAYPTPLTGAVAKRVARQMIVSYRQQALMSKEMQDLVDNATIHYYGEYSKSAAEDPGLAALPVSDKSRVTKKIYKQGILGGIFFASLILAMLVLTGGMRVLTDKPWLPRFWKKKKETDLSAGDEERYAVRYVAPMVWRIYVYALFAVVCYAFLIEVGFVMAVFATWVLLAILVGGLVSGVFASRLFQIERLMQWSGKTHMVASTILTVIIVVGAFVGRFSNTLFF